MGPTTRSPQSQESFLPVSLNSVADNCNPIDISSDPYTTLTSESDKMEYEIQKIQLPPDILTCPAKQSDLIQVVKVIQKLSKHRLASSAHLVSYRRLWFEGPLSSDCNKLSGLSSSSPSSEMTKPTGEGIVCANEEGVSLSTFLCVQHEKYQNVPTLPQWLDDRRTQILHESQILHILLQLATAIGVLIESGLTDLSLSPSNVHFLTSNENGNDNACLPQSHLAPTFFPIVKLSCINQNFEDIILPQSTPPIIENQLAPKSDNFCDFFSKIFKDLLLEAGTETLHISEEWKVIQEMLATSKSDSSLQSEENYLKKLTTKLKNLLNEKSKNKIGILFNVQLPDKNFVGRESELTSLLQIITEEESFQKKNIIVVHGTSGIGKSELVCQLSSKLITSQKAFNIASFNASSADSLTASLYQLCVAQSHQLSQQNSPIPISTTDYIGNPRLLKDIFLDLLLSFSECRLLLIFENCEILTEQVLDLVQIFNENVNSQSINHRLILVSNQLWSSCPFLGEPSTVTLSLPEMNKMDLKDVLLKNDVIFSSEDEESYLNVLEGSPAALKIMTSYWKTTTNNSASKELSVQTLENLSTFKYTELLGNVETEIKPVCRAYLLSLSQLYESLNDKPEEKCLLSKILYVIHLVDGNCGICLSTLIELIDQLALTSTTAAPTISAVDTIKSLLSSLRQLSLIKITDEIMRVPDWGQHCVKILLKTFKTHEVENVDAALLSAYYIILSSKSSEGDCWKIIPHAAKTWISLTSKSVDFAKRFDTMPELIAKLVKSFKKLELMTEFLKKAVDIFSIAYHTDSPHDIHVLKLKFLLAQESLLPRGKVNEAFIVFKHISEHCRSEPREYLMIKLRSQIELGKIHLTFRQEYNKAFSCFQQVQVRAVQKISILELDSEPTVLTARLMHGYAHLQQGNPEEAKKIILQVIPLLERHSDCKLLTIQAKFYLACLLRKTGDLINALMLQTKVFEERDRIIGDKHPDTWASKLEMCYLYSSYDNHEKALLLLRELLEVQEQVLGAPSNRHSLQTMNSIAEIESRLGNFDDSLELYEAIDLIEQQVLSESDEMRISSQLNQAEVLVNLGQYKEAMDIFDLVYTLKSTSSPSDDKITLLCESIVQKREKCERSMEILGNYWLSLTPENVDDPSELAALAKKHEVAVQLTENQDHQGALRFLREVLEDCGQLEETNRFHLNVKADLARVLGLVGKFNESFSVYKEIIPLMDATFGETDELTMLCKDTMGQVFLFSGNQFLKRQMSNLKWFLM